MAQDYGLLRYRPLSASTGTAVAEAIREMIVATGDHYWEVDDVFEGAGGAGPDNICLRPTAIGFAFDAARIVITSTADQVSIGYGPDGLVATDFAGLVANPPPTGLRNITASTATIGSGITGVYLVEYRDDVDTGFNRASSLTILLAQGTTTLAFGAHVGRIITASNASDSLVDVYGDGLLTGPPSATGWLTGSTSTTGDANLHSSVIRTGATRWSFAAPVDAYAAASLPVRSVGGVLRPTPYTMYGLGNAVPFDAAKNAGILGETKYLRAYSSNQSHFVRIVSADPAEQQAWLFWATPALANQNQCILWAKEEA